MNIIKSNHSFARHIMSGSSNTSTYINFLRDKGYKYGELVFDFKSGKLRFLKILRQLAQNLVRSFIYLIIFQKKRFIKSLAYLVGIFQFLLFYLKIKV